MTKYGKLYRYITERPLAYDDETDAKIGTVDPNTNTKWGDLPPSNFTIEQVTQWVEQQIEDGVLDGTMLGQGATRRVEYNDGTTVFKFNYSTDIGNQTMDEVEHYYELKNQWGDCIPKIFAHGQNWSVQEQADEFDSEYIKSLGVTSSFEFVALNRSLRTLCELLAYDYEGELTELLYKNKSFQKAKSVIEQVTGKFFYAPALHELIWNPKFKRLLEFVIDNGFTWDFRFQNLGVVKGKPVMIDYGIRDK